MHYLGGEKVICGIPTESFKANELIGYRGVFRAFFTRGSRMTNVLCEGCREERKGKRGGGVSWPSGSWCLEEEGQGKDEQRRAWTHRFPSVKDVDLLWPMDHFDKPVRKAGMESSFHFPGQETVSLRIPGICLWCHRLEVRKLRWEPRSPGSQKKLSFPNLWMETLRISLVLTSPSPSSMPSPSSWSWNSQVPGGLSVPMEDPISFHCHSLLAGHPTASMFPVIWYSPAARAPSKTQDWSPHASV